MVRPCHMPCPHHDMTGASLRRRRHLHLRRAPRRGGLRLQEQGYAPAQAPRARQLERLRRIYPVSLIGLLFPCPKRATIVFLQVAMTMTVEKIKCPSFSQLGWSRPNQAGLDEAGNNAKQESFEQER